VDLHGPRGSVVEADGASTTLRTPCASTSLRLQEVGMIKSTPDRLIGQGTDWRFFNELKKELKA
jgi:hypothetical protein